MVDPILNSSLDATQLASSLSAILGIFVILIILSIIGAYVYIALALQSIAKRTKTQKTWLAWIPIGQNYLMAKIAKMSGWPVWMMLVIFITSIINAIFTSMNNTGFFSVLNMIIYVAAIITFIVYSTIWNYKICTIRSRPGWWALISLASFPSMLLLGLAATGIAVAFPGAMFMFLVMLIVTCGVFIWPFVMYGILAWSYK